MPAIVIFVVIALVIWLANAVLDAVGGWPGVIAIVVGIVVLIVVVSRYFNRRERIDKLKATPDRVTTLIEAARDSYGEAVDALNQARVELEERRAPLFWDRIYECNDAIVECGENLKQAQAATEDYNDHAPEYDLTDPTQITPLSPAPYDDTMALLGEMSALSHEALAVAEFGTVYETRRQGEQTRAKQDEIEAMTREAVHAAKEAAQRAASAEVAAGRAREASKRAAGDWF